jgi:glycosyltransferase involved in cell wall biosynthesis
MGDEMKKLLFITWSVSYGYGTEKSLADVLNRMDISNYAVSILPLFKTAENITFQKNIKLLNPLIDYTAESFDEEAALKEYYKLLASPLLFNKRIPEHYDCIIACNHNAPSYLASYLKNGRKILWIRGDMRELDYRQFPEGTEQYKQAKQEYEMQAGVFRSFDTIAVISEVVKQSLEELFGITENVVKISNSVDTGKIRRLAREKAALPDKPLFTTLGRLDYNKNQILLLKAAKRLKRQRKDFMIYLLGDGDERELLEKYIQDNRLEENVKILGFVDNPYPYMKNSVATVLTSLSEGFSLVLVESVILDTPVITADVGVAKELTEKYGCGDVIDYDEKELAEVMLRYLNQYDGCKKKFGIGNEYAIETEVRKTEELIAHTLEKPCTGNTMQKLPYPEVTIQEYELENYEIPRDSMYVLRVMKDAVPYEYLIHRRSENDRLVIFNNGAVAGGNVKVPVFQRHSWAQIMKTSTVFCMDPTLYLNGLLQIGWGIGRNENYYLENSSLILKRLIAKMGIHPENTVIYGTSAGGYLSLIMGIYLKGAKVVVDNAQLDIRYWMFKEALDEVVAFCFDSAGIAMQYRERFSIEDAFEKHGYVPKIYMHVNLCSEADNSTQLVPFLKNAEKMKGITEYNDMEIILHYEPEKGHNGISMEDAIAFLYSILDVD